MVKRREQRTHDDPDAKQSTHESSNAPSRNRVRTNVLNTKPSTYVDQCNENTDKRQCERPQLRMDMDRRRGVQLWVHGPGETSPAPSASARDASRAGVCPPGCSVLRNATSAVVSAGLRFFP